MKLNDKQLQIIREAAIASYPNEAVIGITARTAKVLENIHPDPVNKFRVDSKEFYKGKFIALVHSHTQVSYAFGQQLDICTPSEMDLATQIAMDIPFGIIGTDGEFTTDIMWWPDIETPLEERDKFVYGVWDCYGVIRHWYWKNRGIDLGDRPRTMECADKEAFAYEHLIGKCGFVEVEKFRELEVGDVLLLSIGSKHINHAGVFVGDGKFVHHALNTIPREDNYTKYANFVVKHLRHPGDSSETKED